MKIFGAVLTVIACALLGFYRCLQMEREAEYVKGILNALLYIKKQLSLSKTLMPELMESAGTFGGSASGVFSECGKLLRDGSITFCDAWESAVASSTIGNKKTKAVLCELGAQLGKNDVEGELATVCDAENKLTELYDAMCAQVNKEGSLYKKAGVLLGVVIVILLY